MAGEQPIVFMDISIGGNAAGRIKIELFSDIVPKVLEFSNQRQLKTLDSSAQENIGFNLIS